MDMDVWNLFAKMAVYFFVVVVVAAAVAASVATALVMSRW